MDDYFNFLIGLRYNKYLLERQIEDLKHSYDEKYVLFCIFLYFFGIIQAAPATLPQE